MKLSKKITFSVACAGLLMTSACTDPGQYNPATSDNKTQSGVIMGGILGAAVGALTSDNRGKGAVKGAVLGAAAGGIAGSIMDKQEADLRRDLGNDVQVTNTGDRLIVTLPQDILFATGSANLRPDLQRDMRTVAANLQAYPNSTVQILGHTDNVGDATYNQGLSFRRAQAVTTVLINEGVSGSRISPTGRGEDQPIASNLSPEGRAQNRRVEIVILPSA